MLNRHSPPLPLSACGIDSPARQRGVTLMISLIILVALTLGGLALVRSVGTANIIAGNLAFQQAATHASQVGIEDGVANFLEANALTTFETDDFTRAYSASAAGVGNPATTAAWETYWRTTINPNPRPLPVAAKICVDRVCTMPTDGAGNTVSYTIQRLCQIAGDPLVIATGCASGAQKSTLVGASLAAGSVALPMITQYYYRITARTVGPRNTVSYVQTIVAK